MALLDGGAHKNVPRSVGVEGSSVELVCCAPGGILHLLIQPENLKSNPLVVFLSPFDV